MSEKVPNVQLKVIKLSPDGDDYLKMMVPTGWKVSFSRNDKYCGYGYPFGFSVSFISPDNSSLIRYNSPINYVDDYLFPQPDNAPDSYGRLHHRFLPVEQYIDLKIAENLYDYSQMAFAAQRDFKDIGHMQQQKELETRKNYERNYPNRLLEGRYYRATVREYRYNHEHFKRIRACSVLIDAETYRQYLPLPNQQQRLRNTGLNQLALEYPGLTFDEKSKGYIYLAEHATQWCAKNFFILDAPIDDYAHIYSNYFMPMVNKGVAFGTGLLQDLQREQQNVNAKNEYLRRQMRKKVDEKYRLKQQQEQQSRTFFENVNTANQNTDSDLQKTDAFFSRHADNKPKYRKFRDSTGKIHTIATNGVYAYMKNGKIFTSRTDIKMELGTMWEQLTPLD